jgi:hypothetical protein
MQDYSTAFAGNQAALGAVTSAWKPILDGGSIPYGYSPELDSLLRSNIINQGSAATTNSENAAQLRATQQSGGNNPLPTGAQAQVDADIQASGNASTNQALAQEKEAGYEQGISNLDGATNAELGVASGENETGLASSAIGSGSLALNAGQTQFQENLETSPLAITGQILGDIGGAVGDATGIGNIASMFSTPSNSSSNTAPGSDFGGEFSGPGGAPIS